MSYFTRNMDKCSRLHSFPVTRYVSFRYAPSMHLDNWIFIEQSARFSIASSSGRLHETQGKLPKKPTDVVWLSLHAANYLPARVWENRFFALAQKKLIFVSIFVQKSDLHIV